MAAPKIKLNNGLEMPALGLGTLAFKGNEGIQTIRDAIDAGYRHFDTAYAYGNEAEVGHGIKQKIAEGAVRREEIFFVTKLWCTFHEPDKVEYICRKSLANSGLDYIDLYLMHFPVGFKYENDVNQWPRNADGSRAIIDVDYLDTWKAMEKLVHLGLVKSIGVSNFNSEQIARLMNHATIKPVTNQVECSPAINQKKLTEFCKQHGNVVITAFCPLGGLYEQAHDRNLRIMAQKYGKTIAQIVLRYLVELGTVPIPKSTNKGRLQQNIDVFDLELTGDERRYLDSLHTGQRLVSYADSRHSTYWPFRSEF